MVSAERLSIMIYRREILKSKYNVGNWRFKASFYWKQLQKIFQKAILPVSRKIYQNGSW